MKLLHLSCAMLVAFFALGCGNSEAEDFMKQLIVNLNSIADCLEKNDAEGALTAGRNLKTLRDRAKTIKVTKSQDKSLQAKYEPELKSVTQRIEAAMGKNPELKPKLAELGTILGR